MGEPPPSTDRRTRWTIRRRRSGPDDASRPAARAGSDRGGRARAVPDPRGDRPGRHGLDPEGGGPLRRPDGRDQGTARLATVARDARPIPARGPGHRTARTPEHRSGPRGRAEHGRTIRVSDDVGWSLDMRALCFRDTGRPDEALEDLLTAVRLQLRNVEGLATWPPRSTRRGGEKRRSRPATGRSRRPPAPLSPARPAADPAPDRGPGRSI